MRIRSWKNPLTDEERLAILAARAAGERAHVIGARHRVSRQTIYQLARSAGEPPRPARNPWWRPEAQS